MSSPSKPRRLSFRKQMLALAAAKQKVFSLPSRCTGRATEETRAFRQGADALSGA
jgi:hypothetical protein